MNVKLWHGSNAKIFFNVLFDSDNLSLDLGTVSGERYYYALQARIMECSVWLYKSCIIKCS